MTSKITALFFSFAICAQGHAEADLQDEIRYHLSPGQYFEYRLIPSHPSKNRTPTEDTWRFWVTGGDDKKGWQLVGYLESGEAPAPCFFEMSPLGVIRHLDSDEAHFRPGGYLFPEYPSKNPVNWKSVPNVEGDFFTYHRSKKSIGESTRLSSEAHLVLQEFAPGKISVSYELEPGTNLPRKVELKNQYWKEATLAFPPIGPGESVMNQFSKAARYYFKALQVARTAIRLALKAGAGENVDLEVEQIARGISAAEGSIEDLTKSLSLYQKKHFDPFIRALEYLREKEMRSNKGAFQNTHAYFRYRMSKEFPVTKDWDTLAPLEVLHSADLNEQKHDLKATVHSHKATVLDFCIYRCSGCPKAAATLERIKDKMKGQSVAFVGLNVDEETDAAALKGSKHLLSRLKVSYPVLRIGQLGAKENEQSFFFVMNYPTVFVLDQRANVREILLGFESYFERVVTDAIEDLLH
jgi:thiol-disulfide isomerase/thioredoxin